MKVLKTWRAKLVKKAEAEAKAEEEIASDQHLPSSITHHL
jgi:hypothetical protein